MLYLLFQYAVTGNSSTHANGPVLDLVMYERIGGARKAVALRCRVAVRCNSMQSNRRRWANSSCESPPCRGLNILLGGGGSRASELVSLACCMWSALRTVIDTFGLTR